MTAWSKNEFDGEDTFIVGLNVFMRTKKKQTNSVALSPRQKKITFLEFSPSLASSKH
jgi:hypothetical protein